jgi:phosphopantothenoylcysteine decarboxylase/phosphopantothenate--cysteine ligase
VRRSARGKAKTTSVLVTAGPTREKIDPIRFISNYSQGNFGYELAREARRRGLTVTLVSGPTYLKIPRGIRLIKIESADDMRRAVTREFKKHDCLIMAAAVSDWRVRRQSTKKMKKCGSEKTLELTENPDILKELSGKKGDRVLVGFALETEKLEKNAIKKLKEKNLDIIIANRLTQKAKVFGDNKTDILMIDRFGHKRALRHKSKRELAEIILDKVARFGI